MRSGLYVVAGAALVGIVMGFFSVNSATRHQAVIDDLFTSLVYYAEATDGGYPANEGELFAMPFFEPDPEGGYRLTNRDSTCLDKRVIGARIESLDEYNVQWGVDLSELEIDESGNVVDSAGQEVMLLRAVAPNPIRRQFTHDLVLAVRMCLEGEEPHATPEPQATTPEP